MNGRKLTLTISGREALPVRAIPYIAEWKEVKASLGWIAWIADHLAQGKKAPRGTTPLTAYQWLKDKSPIAVSPNDWALTVKSLGVRVASLRTQANELPTPTTSFIDAGKLEVLVEELPRGAFVWLEEFELTYRNSRERRPSDSFILNLTPMACDDFNTRTLVLFGFEEHEHYSNNQQEAAIKREGMVAWSNAPTNAAMWLKRASVKPDEAAMLLCRIDPLERDWRGNAPDPARIYADGDEAWPDRYRLLLRVFLEVAETNSTPRTLLVWRDVAKGEGLRYHEWIDEHVQVQFEELPADAGGKDYAETVGAGETATGGKDEKPLPWWQADYDIHLLARNAGDSLHRKKERTSNRKIGDAVVRRIEAEEQRGKKRKPPSGEHIKNTVLKGWQYQPDKAK
jgi:hypothetical protein